MSSACCKTQHDSSVLVALTAVAHTLLLQYLQPSLHETIYDNIYNTISTELCTALSTLLSVGYIKL